MAAGDWKGVQTSFGAVQINTTSAAFQLLDQNGSVIIDSPTLSNVLVSSSSKASFNSVKMDVCNKAVQGYDAKGGQRSQAAPNGLSGQTQDSCCKACNNASGLCSCSEYQCEQQAPLALPTQLLASCCWQQCSETQVRTLLCAQACTPNTLPTRSHTHTHTHSLSLSLSHSLAHTHSLSPTNLCLAALCSPVRRHTV